MLLKHIGLAALAATFITGGTAVASAESGVGVAGTGSGYTSSALQSDAQAGSMRSYYGYAMERPPVRASRQHIRTNKTNKMKHRS